MATRADGRHERRAELAWGAAAVAVTCIVTFLALHLWDADMRVPFSYGGDAGQNQLIVKSVLDHGWYEHNPDLGAPFGLKLYDFPVVSGDNLQIVLMKAIGVFTNDSALVINLFFLLTFPLTAAIAYACTRLLSLSRPASAAVAVLFAVLPAHFIRGENHLFIQAYYAVPIGAYLALRALDPAPVAWRARRTLALILGACLVVGSAHVYYAAFAMSLLAVAAVIRLVGGPRRSAITAAVFLALVGTVVVANHLPNINYQHQHGKNRATQRPASEAESYGLKVAAMVLPVAHHRLHPLAKLRSRYDDDGTQLQEGDPQALGTVGTIGFVGLLVFGLAVLVDRRRRFDPPPLVVGLAALTIAAVVIGTVGGFSSVFSYVVTAQLRAWGRISVFIAFFSLVAVALAGDRLVPRVGRHDALAVLAAIVLVGCLDQTNGSSKPAYASVQADYRSDAAFVKQIEQRLPAGAAVYELPYEPFPEPQPQWIPGSGPYDLARGYIHSHDLRWSYGLMKGRLGDWNAAVMQLPPALLAQAVVTAGFSGIYLDRQGYADNGRHALEGLTEETSETPIDSPNGRLAFLDLRAYAQRLRGQHTPSEMAALRDRVLVPTVVIWGGGFSRLQQDLEGRSYQVGASAQIILRSPGPGVRRLRLVFDAKPAYPAPAGLELEVPGGKPERFEIPTGGKRIDIELPVPIGVSTIDVKVNGHPQLAYPAVTQPYYLRILDPLVVDQAFAPFGELPGDRRAAAWLAPFQTI
jgi:phosphoglycerol transferase